MSFCIGLMSGTSMDGIDAALIETDGQGQLRSIGGYFFAYPKIFQHLLKAAEFTAKQAKADIFLATQNFPHCWQSYGENLQLTGIALQTIEDTALAFINQQLNSHSTQLSLEAIIACSTELHRQACQTLLEQQKISVSDIEVVGYHGQTLYHKPSLGISWQAGDGQQLANLLGCQVVSAFRQQDIQQGGQGAPLVPLYHQALINQDPCYSSIVVNCGGIANITIVHGPASDELLAFDAGPGNVLLDRLVRQQTLGQKSFDRDGHLAQPGKVCDHTLAILKKTGLPKHFLHKTPPKSLDSHDCQLPEELYRLNLADGLTTLAAFSADCLVESLYAACQNTNGIQQIILAGGGWYHPVILREFQQRIAARFNRLIPVLTAKQKGWQQDLLEAEAFAYLAKRSLLGLSLSTPLTTGVKQECTGGQCFYPQLP